MTISDLELDGMRATMNDSLPDTVLISRASRAPDGLGGQSETWATVATTQGRLSAEFAPPDEPLLGDRPSSVQRWQITMPSDTDVTYLDRCLIGTRTFEVRGTNRERSWAIDVIVHCTEIL